MPRLDKIQKNYSPITQVSPCPFAIKSSFKYTFININTKSIIFNETSILMEIPTITTPVPWSMKKWLPVCIKIIIYKKRFINLNKMSSIIIQISSFLMQIGTCQSSRPGGCQRRSASALQNSNVLIQNFVVWNTKFRRFEYTVSRFRINFHTVFGYHSWHKCHAQHVQLVSYPLQTRYLSETPLKIRLGQQRHI